MSTVATAVPDALMGDPPAAAPARSATRIESIDGLRGLVMLLMLVDHAREFFFYGHQVGDPMDLATTSPALFFTRLAAHLCAPVFVALTGLSAWLYGAGRSPGGAAGFLVKTAVEEGWLGPAERCALAVVIGLALLVGAEWLLRRPGSQAADEAPAALAAGGVAMLFGAAYSAGVLYALLPALLGFAAMAGVALAAMALALRHGRLVAAIGILGAFATPVLVDTQDPFLPGLFSYLLVVTAAALAVVRRVGAVWLGWAALLMGAGWVVLGGILAPGPDDLWWPALFVPAAVALHLALLPGIAMESLAGRRLAVMPVGVLALAGLALLAGGTSSLGPAAGLLLLTPVTIWGAAREARLNRLPWLAALAGLLLLLFWPIGAWAPPGEAITIEGVVQSILPGVPWPPEALHPFLIAALLLAGMQAAAGAWGERRQASPLPWAALPAAVPLLALLIAYGRVRGFAIDGGWAAVSLALAAALIGMAALAMREAAPQRAGVHAAGAVGAVALGAAMLLADQWLSIAIALFLPPLAWIEARAGLPALRRVAMVVAGLVLVRLLLNWQVAAYAFGDWPVVNGLLPAYGLPAASFALAAFLFHRRGDDLAVRVLEAGAVALLAALMLLEIRHAVTGGDIAETRAGWRFQEAALQVFGLAVIAALLRWMDARLGGRVVLLWAWRLHQTVAVALGAWLVLRNPAFDKHAIIAALPVLNELLLAYGIPALLAALLARSAGSAWPPGFREVLAAYAFAAALAWVTLEVRHLFHLEARPGAMALAGQPPGEAELYAYSGAWLLLAAALLAVGIRRAIPALRLAALAVMAVAVGKAFLFDMSGLVGLWRVLSFLGLGLALIALGWVYRRFVTPPGRV